MSQLVKGATSCPERAWRTRWAGRVWLGVLLPVAAAALATPIAVLASAMIGAPVGVAIRFAWVAAVLLCGLFWLPYTMATVLRAPRWPVVAAACVVGPLTGPLAAWVATVF